MKLVDTHCHLDEESFTQDCDETIRRAIDAGVTKMLAVGITLESCRRVLELADKYDSVHPIIGLHPNYVSAAKPSDWDEITLLAKTPKVVAIGETGLDQYWDHAPIELQVEYFDRHIDLARELGLPFVVHCRDAEEKTLDILQKHAATGPINGVMHSFCGSATAANRCIGMGMHLSFGGMVTFKRNDALREISRSVPLNRLLVETDSPYLAPTPLRGKRNEPANVRLTAACLAEVRGISKEALAEATTQNATSLFRLPRESF